MKGICALLLGLAVVSCARKSPAEPVEGLPYAIATLSCGPTDKPVVVIYLTSTPVELQQPVSPFMQVYLPDSFHELRRGRVYPVGNTIDDAMVTFHSSGLPARMAQRGEVGVSSLANDEIRGFVDLVFAGGLKMRGSFIAPFQERQLSCV